MLPPVLTLRRTVLTILLGIVAAGALVTQAAAQSSPTVLLVDGPAQVEVDEPAVFRVSDYLLGRPVAGAYLFAFPIDPPPDGVSAASALDPALADALGQAVPEDADLTPDSYSHWGGEFLGLTNSEGKLRTAFGWPGHRLILALKRGAIPGYTTIEVVPPTLQALAIRGPELINAGGDARYLVSDRRDGSPVPGAWVFAIPRGVPTQGLDPLPLQPIEADEAVAVELAALADGTLSDDELTAEALRRWRAIFLGVTNERGVVEHAYANPDRYLVVALKRQAWPAYTKTLVVPRELALSGPAQLKLGQPGTYTVTDLTRTPIEGAWLYAFPVDRALAPSTLDRTDALAPELETALGDDEELTAARLSFWGGIFLGRTNERGQLTHAYRQPGDYVVVALKRTFRLDHMRTAVTAQQLAVAGPGVVNAGDPAEFTVTNRRSGAAVARSAVFAIPRGPFPVPLEADGAPLDAAIAAAVDAELLAALAEDGERFRGDVAARWGVIFLGWTEARGKVSHAFEAPDHYVIVALKREWQPGYTRLAVVPRQLTLEAPSAVQAGETFRVRVGDLTGAPVGGSLVFAFPLPFVTATGAVDGASDAAVAAELAGAADADDDEAIAAAARRRGWLLGRTNDEGLLKAEIERSGQYLLVAVKRSFRHARSRIEVLPTIQQLAIAGPGEVVAGEPARFKVSNAATQQPVSRAAVYAIPLPQPVPQPLPEPLPSDALSAAEVELAEAVVADVAPDDELLSNVAIDRWGARLLGFTDEHGVVAAAFEGVGRYLIVAVKPHYRAAYTHLLVVPPPDVRQLVVEGPGSVVQGEPAKFLVTEATSGEPVSRVAMYSLQLTNAISPDESLAPTAAELATADALLAEVAPDLEQLSAETISRWRLRFLGWTNADGVLVASFEGVGRHLVLGFKSGHVPGYTQLTVLPRMNPRQLAIEGPSSIPQHAPANFRVTELGTRSPVPNTAMWAIQVGSTPSGGVDGVAAEALGADLLESLAPSGGAAPEADALLSGYGATFLGFTDRNGELSHRFGQAGRYVIIAFEPSHLPAFSLLTVTPVPGVRALQIEGPGVVRVGERATFFVSTRGGDAVAGALVVAWPVDRPIPVPLDAATDAEALSSALSASGGRILGRTNERGTLSAVFLRPNDFVVYALQAGFLPGVTKLSVVGEGEIAPAPRPLPAEIAPTDALDAQ